jgi:hypothetical protein
MRGRCKKAIALLLAWTRTGLAAERTSAIFDFRIIDTSLECATNSPRADAQARPTRPARDVWAQQVSNLIRNVKVVVRRADTGHMWVESDTSRSRAFDVLFGDDLLLQDRGVF